MKTVILVGGSGSRLWPLSRRNHPKQFLKVDSTFSLFQEAVLRNKPLSDGCIIVSGDAFAFTIASQLEEIEIGGCSLLLESIGRNTAPAMAMACLAAGPEEILLAVPSDHKIIGMDLYAEAIAEGEKLARQDRLVTFGIRPSRPETGFGYIRHKGSAVLEFCEKPDHETAERFVRDGGYLWNSGMFMFRSRVLLDELRQTRPDIVDACEAAYDAALRAKACQPNGLEGAEIFRASGIDPIPLDLTAVPGDSIDYAVMEKSDRIAVVRCAFDWYDVGSFEAYGDFIVKDRDGNALDQNALYNDCRNALVINDAPDKLIVLNRLRDIVVVNTSDTVYISGSGYSHEIKEIIATHAETESVRDHLSDRLRSYRPWGYYEVLLSESGYKVKRLVLYPGRRLSLQRHRFRSEHWTVTSGVGLITIGETAGIYRENESAFIPLGAVHRAENISDQELVIIETGIGEQVREDDIERIEDDYGRA